MANLLFRDVDTGEYYSDEQGNILKLLDFGEIIAGGVSPVKAVALENASGFTVENPAVSRIGDISTDILEFSYSASPFEPQSELVFQGNHPAGDIGTFYVRMRTSIDSTLERKQVMIQAAAFPVA